MKMLSTAALALLMLVTAATGFAEPAQEVTVSAAISLKNAFEEIGKLFESRYRGSRVILNFAASGDLARQIRGGAPVDVFASAAAKDMDSLEHDGLIEKNTRADFATNEVALIVPVGGKNRISSFKDLEQPGLGRVAVGNPKTMPIGRYADEVLRYFAIADRIREKLVYTENVRQVLEYVARGEVDAGIVYVTDALVNPRDVAIAATAPAGSHKPVLYPIAAVKGSWNGKAAGDFISLVRSDEGRKVLLRHGFGPVGP
jgi:molybdate transport system substrate-binding protein